MNMTSLTPRTGGQILVQQLITHGVKQLFCVPGESYLAVLDALHDADIGVTVCRQEGGAAMMAEAQGKLTGQPGICFVTRGPGATNASAGVHIAHQDSTPMILFVGQVARNAMGREAFQELDYSAVFGTMAKWVVQIDDPARVPELISRAFHVATSGRPGPVVVALPEDMLRDEVAAVDRPHLVRPVQDVDIEAATEAYRLIAAAERPVAIIGGAGWDRGTAAMVADLGRAAGLPLIAAFRRQDAVGNDCPVYAGNLGYGPNPMLVKRVREADVVLVLGARLGEATTDGYALITPDHPGQTLIHVHPDASELNRVYRADLAICADVLRFASMAELAAQDAGNPHPAGAEAHAAYRVWSEPQPRDGVALDLGLCVAAMRERLRPRTRSSATARAISRAGGTATGLIPPSRASSPPPPARWDMAFPRQSRRRCAFRSARSSPWRATGTS